ncbi:MAG: response regulator, partial [Chloroflexi bacterium]|nr:response regulator [Chloroflexota bacterium]
MQPLLDRIFMQSSERLTAGQQARVLQGVLLTALAVELALAAWVLYLQPAPGLPEILPVLVLLSTPLLLMRSTNAHGVASALFLIISTAATIAWALTTGLSTPLLLGLLFVQCAAVLYTPALAAALLAIYTVGLAFVLPLNFLLSFVLSGGALLVATTHIVNPWQLAERARQLQEAKERAEAANRAKSIFLANMSHELRTPLNAVLGFAQIIERDADLSPTNREHLIAIRRGGEHLLALIEDVLEISKIEAGQLSLDESDIDIHLLLETITEMFRIRAEAKGLTLHVQLPSNMPRYIRTDERKLRQVLINLLGNAVKFTNEGRIDLTVAYANNDSVPRLRFTVRDTGIGIAPEEQAEIFEPFTQTAYAQKLQEGTGLGLTISRQYIVLMGGSIHLNSEPGVGTTFVFDVAIKPTNPELARQLVGRSRRVAQVSSANGQVRVLLAEDEEDNRRFLRQALTHFGFAVQEACDGREAVTLAAEWQPHIILMDIRMPVLNGMEAARQIRSSQPDVPIIAVTASAF